MISRSSTRKHFVVMNLALRGSSQRLTPKLGKPILLLLRTFLIGTSVLPAGAFAYTVTVTSDADSGKSTFRAAIEEANRNPKVDRIIFRPTLGPITLLKPVVYSGSQALQFTGRNTAIVNGGAPFTLLTSTGGANLLMREMSFQGSGGAGLIVAVPAHATGTIKLSLDRCELRDNRGNGLHIDERTDTVGFGSDSDASIQLIVKNCSISGNGSGGVDDSDGIRVDEGGHGDITLLLADSRASANAFDGLELDEQGDGNVMAQITNSVIDGNGFGNLLDLEDGIDIDEAGAGNLLLKVEESTFNGNLEQGLDLEELDAGLMNVRLCQVSANDNLDRGARFVETLDGDQFIELQGVLVEHNGDDGLRIDEGGPGDQTLTAREYTSTGNDGDGIQGEERDDGSMSIHIEDVLVQDNSSDGIKFEEFQSGDGFVRVLGGSILGQGTQGFDLDEQADGDFTVALSNLTISRNGLEGVDVTERLVGHLSVDIVRCDASGNFGDDGLQFEEGGDGHLTASVVETISSHGFRDGVQFIEAGNGDLAASIAASIFQANQDAGLRISQSGSGAGQLNVNDCDISANGTAQILATNVLIVP